MWRLDVALLRAAALRGGLHYGNVRVLLPLLQVAASLPRTSRKKRAFPPGAAALPLRGCLAPAVHAPPPLSRRDLTRGEAPRAPSVAFRIMQGSVLPFWPYAVRLLQRPREQEQRAPCLRSTCCLAWGLSSLSFVGVRIKRPTARGDKAVRPRKPRGTAMSLDPCLQYGGIREERAIVGDRKGTCSV